MVEVFKTNVMEAGDATRLLSLFCEHYPHYAANFDLEDDDKILRVESTVVNCRHVISLLVRSGFACEALP